MSHFFLFLFLIALGIAGVVFATLYQPEFDEEHVIEYISEEENGS